LGVIVGKGMLEVEDKNCDSCKRKEIIVVGKLSGQGVGIWNISGGGVLEANWTANIRRRRGDMGVRWGNFGYVLVA
jgi:hypothetical protein